MSSCEYTAKPGYEYSLDYTFLNPRWLIRSFGFLSLVRRRCWHTAFKNVFYFVSILLTKSTFNLSQAHEKPYVITEYVIC